MRLAIPGQPKTPLALLVLSIRSARLGRLDGLDQDRAAGEGDEGSVILAGFSAAQGAAFEALPLTHGLLDTRLALVECLGRELGRA